MLVWAARWRSSEFEAVAPSTVGHYVDGFGRHGDAGVVAEDETGRGVGAAWYRCFSADEPGFGFLDEEIPELSIAATPECRGRGVGTALLEALVDAAKRDGQPALSLSVERDNPALRLYERAGFRQVQTSGNALTMRLDLLLRTL